MVKTVIDHKQMESYEIDPNCADIAVCVCVVLETEFWHHQQMEKKIEKNVLQIATKYKIYRHRNLQLIVI